MDFPVRLVIEPRTNECSASLAWDRDAHVLSATLSHQPPTADSPSTFRQVLEASCKIARPTYRLVAGDSQFFLDTARRLIGFEIRTNPLQWAAAQLDALPLEIENVSARFSAEFDPNGIASFKTSTRLSIDAVQHQVCVALGNASASRWHRIATGIALGTTMDLYLCRVRLDVRGVTFSD